MGEANPVDSGISRGSPAAPVALAAYLSGISDEVERPVPGTTEPGYDIFVDDIGWWADSGGDEMVASEAAAASMTGQRTTEWPSTRETKAAIFRRKKTSHGGGEGWRQHCSVQQVGK